MATRFVTRSLLTTAKQTLASSASASASASSSSLFRLRPLFAAANNNLRHLIPPPSATSRGFATRQTSSSLSDPNPNWSNRPPKETILLDGCDFEHWLVVMMTPEGDPTRDEIIDSYIKTLATVVGSEEEARMKIYSVSTRHYYAFGALVSEELSYKLKELPRVRWVLPDSYLDVKNKDYGGEPFINGQAVPYDPKYHEEWVRNNARASERNRRNDRPRNFDRSRNFERRKEMQMGNQSAQGPGPNTGGGPPGNMGPGPNMGGGPPRNMGPGPNMGGGPPRNMGPGPNMGPPPNMGGGPPNNMGGMPPNMGGMQQNNMGVPQNYMQGANNMGGMPPTNMGGVPPNNMGGVPPNNMGPVPNHPQNFQYGNGPNNGGMPYQSGPGPNQNNFAPNSPGGNPYQNPNVSGRDMPPPPPPHPKYQ